MIEVEDLLPGRPAVDGLEDSALDVGAVRVAQRRHVDDVGVVRVNDQAADLLHVGEADVLPVLTEVGRLEDTVPYRQIGAVEPFAGAHVDDVRMRGRDREIADRSRGRGVEDRSPGAPEVVGLPHAPVVDPYIEDARLGRNPDPADRAAGAKRADQPVLQLLMKGGIDRLGMYRARERRNEQGECGQAAS